MRLDEIRGITLYGAWAWAVAHLGKDVENRAWPDRMIPRWLEPGRYLAIHAGANLGAKKGKRAMVTELMRLLGMADRAGWSGSIQAFGQGGEIGIQAWRPGFPADAILGLPTGAQPGLVRGRFRPMHTRAIVAVARYNGRIEDAPPTGWYVGKPSRGFLLADVVTLPAPVPVERGGLGLWTLDGPILERVNAQLVLARAA